MSRPQSPSWVRAKSTRQTDWTGGRAAVPASHPDSAQAADKARGPSVAGEGGALLTPRGAALSASRPERCLRSSICAAAEQG